MAFHGFLDFLNPRYPGKGCFRDPDRCPGLKTIQFMMTGTRHEFRKHSKLAQLHWASYTSHTASHNIENLAENRTTASHILRLMVAPGFRYLPTID